MVNVGRSKRKREALKFHFLRFTVGYVFTNVTYFFQMSCNFFSYYVYEKPALFMFLKLDSHKGRDIRFKCQMCKTLTELNSGLYGK